MQLKAVFFDVGGTLETFRYTQSLRLENTLMFRTCLLKSGIQVDITDEQLYHLIVSGIATYQKWNRQSLIELPTAQIWSQYVFKESGVREGQIAPISEELAFLYETQYFIREMRPEIPAVLEKIKAMGLVIGCISNTQSLTQVPATLKKYGIAEYFEPVVLSSAFGQRKPGPSIFYHAARLASLPTGSILYVGDKINRDVLGSKRAGYRLSIKIQHAYDDGDVDEGAVPDAVINNMEELLSLLQDELASDRHTTQKPQPNRIKAIFFDAGNILYHKPRKGKNLKRFIARHHLKATSDVRKEKRRLKDLAFQGIIDRGEYYAQVIKLYGVTDEQILAEGIQAILLDATTVEIIEGVPETLKALKKIGFILGIISDTATPIQVKLSWFEQAGFGDIFDTFISSKELGTRKPAPVIYEEAYLRVGLNANQAIFVGHKASELKGARDVGLKTVAFNYDKNARADDYIERFTDLLKLEILQDAKE